MATSARHKRAGWRYRGNVALRLLAGTAGAYLVASLAAFALARLLPASKVEATLLATMLAFVIAPGVTVWAFLARGPWRALGGVLLAAALLWLLAWAIGAPA